MIMYEVIEFESVPPESAVFSRKYDSMVYEAITRFEQSMTWYYRNLICVPVTFERGTVIAVQVHGKTIGVLNAVDVPDDHLPFYRIARRDK